MLVRDIYGHIIGDIDKGVFTKVIRGYKHFLREPEPSIAVDATAFDAIISRHARTLVVLDNDTKDTYSITTEDFKQSKRELDRGHGKQYYVPLRLWQLRKSAQKRLI